MIFNAWFYSEGFRSYYFMTNIMTDHGYWGWGLRDYSYHQQLDFGDRWAVDFDVCTPKYPKLNFDSKKRMISDLLGRIK